jgi:hypothetical protein
MLRKSIFVVTVLMAVSVTRPALPAVGTGIQEKAGQETEQAADKEKEKTSGIVAVPVVFYTPETKLAFGAGGIYYFALTGDKAVTRPSSVSFSGVYTQLKQSTVEVNPDFYLKDGYHIQAYLQYYKFPDYFYGIGNATSSDLKEAFTSNYWWLNIEALKCVRGAFNIGFQYFFDDTKLVEVEAGRQLDSEDITGSGGGKVSGIGPFMTYDSRDSIFFPTRGSYHQFSAMTFGRALGSDFRFSRFSLELRRYHGFSPSRILAFQAKFLFETGDPPFWRMGQLGGQEIMRGYYSGRYRDKNMMAFQVEYRWVPAFWRIGLAAFAGIGDVADKPGNFRLGSFKYSHGLGLRFVVDRRQRLHLRLDYGLGKGTSGVYFTAVEAF